MYWTRSVGCPITYYCQGENKKKNQNYINKVGKGRLKLERTSNYWCLWMMWTRKWLRAMTEWSTCRHLKFWFLNFLISYLTHPKRYCGHREQNSVMDERAHGFPFDRDIDFDIHKNPFTSRWIIKEYINPSILAVDSPILLTIYLLPGSDPPLTPSPQSTTL